MTLAIRSPAFEDGSPLPVRFTCDGADVSPPLEWEGVPEGTEVLALVVDDPDAPDGTWVHWVLYGIYDDRSRLDEGVPPDAEFGSAYQGENDFGDLGWGGPCPPPGDPHRYVFKLHALDADPGLGAGATKAELLEAMEGHVLEEARLTGTYRRGG